MSGSEKGMDMVMEKIRDVLDGVVCKGPKHCGLSPCPSCAAKEKQIAVAVVALKKSWSRCRGLFHLTRSGFDCGVCNVLRALEAEVDRGRKKV